MYCIVHYLYACESTQIIQTYMQDEYSNSVILTPFIYTGDSSLIQVRGICVAAQTDEPQWFSMYCIASIQKLCVPKSKDM